MSVGARRVGNYFSFLTFSLPLPFHCFWKIQLIRMFYSSPIGRVVADVNCLAPASLTLALLPSLQATSLSITAYNQPAVVVNVASSAHIRASFSLLQSYDHDHGLVSCLKEALTPTESSAQELDTNRDQ